VDSKRNEADTRRREVGVRRRFFVEKFSGNTAVMTGDAAHHLGRVLRAEAGQVYELSDGKAAWLARIEKAGREVMVVENNQAFGTWALFDNQPRLMTARALEDVHLLKIGSDDFYELLSDHDEITPAIFKALIERVKTLMPG